LKDYTIPVGFGRTCLTGEQHGENTKCRLLPFLPCEIDPFTTPMSRNYFQTRGALPLSGVEWASLKAFIARLHTASPDFHYAGFKGMWALLEALEREQTPSALDDLVLTAACWILYARCELRNNSEDYRQYGFDEGFEATPMGRWRTVP
jgi:hypothetical protein